MKACTKLSFPPATKGTLQRSGSAVQAYLVEENHVNIGFPRQLAAYLLHKPVHCGGVAEIPKGACGYSGRRIAKLNGASVSTVIGGTQP